MAVYLMNLGFVWIMSILAIKFAMGRNEIYIDIKKPNGLFVFLAFLSLFLVCGLRWRVGTDYGNYIDMYNINASKSFVEILLGGEPLFMLITWVSSRNGYHPEVMFLICAFIITGLMVLSIRDYSTMFELSMFLFITDMSYYAQFNGIRQCMAGAVIFWGFRYLIQGNFKKYLVMILIACTIHISALLFISLYFIVRLRPWSKWIMCIAGVFFISFVFFPQVMEILFHTVDGRFQGYFDLTGGYSSYGVKPMRVIVAGVPIIISFIFYKSLKRTNPNVDVLINLSVLNFLFMFIALKNVSLSRMCMYLAPYNMLLIPEFVRMDKTKARYLVYVGIMIVFMLYMIVLLPVDSNLLPYRTIFSK